MGSNHITSRALSRCPNTEKSIVWPPCGEFAPHLAPIGEKSGGRRLNKHSWSAHLLLIWRRPEQFNSQLNFAGWSADVTQIHSSVGLLPAAYRSPHGGPWATVRNFGSGGQTETTRSPAGCRTNVCGWPQDHLPILIPQQVIARWSLDVRGITVRSSTGLSLGCAVCTCLMFYVVDNILLIIYW